MIVYQIDTYAWRNNGPKIIASEQGASGLLDATIKTLRPGEAVFAQAAGDNSDYPVIKGDEKLVERLRRDWTQRRDRSMADARRATDELTGFGHRP